MKLRNNYKSHSINLWSKNFNSNLSVKRYNCTRFWMWGVSIFDNI